MKYRGGLPCQGWFAPRSPIINRETMNSEQDGVAVTKTTSEDYRTTLHMKSIAMRPTIIMSSA